MSLITSTFVIAVHDEILKETGVGRAGCDYAKLEGVLSRIDQQMYYNDVNFFRNPRRFNQRSHRT